MCTKILLGLIVFCALSVCGTYLQLERQIVSHQTCRSDSECIRNAICVNNTLEKMGYCTCVPGYLLEKNLTNYECLKEADHLGDFCTHNVQCQLKFSTMSECRFGRCQCKDRTHFYHDKCWQTIALGDYCHFSQECLLVNGMTAFCVDGRCECNLRMYPVKTADGYDCVKIVKLGEPCASDNQCSAIPFARCMGVCHCRPGYTVNYGETACLQQAGYIGDACKEDIQCEFLHHTVCRDSACQCLSGYHSRHNSCYRSVTLGDRCSRVEECITKPALENQVLCNKGVCTCLNGKTKNCINGSVKAVFDHFVFFGVCVLSVCIKLFV